MALIAAILVDTWWERVLVARLRVSRPAGSGRTCSTRAQPSFHPPFLSLPGPGVAETPVVIKRRGCCRNKSRVARLINDGEVLKSSRSISRGGDPG